MLPASARRQGVLSVHPQRYQGFDPIFVQDILYYAPERRRFARNASYERSCFWQITTQPHPKKLIVFAVVHIPWATARAGPTKHVGGLMGTVDVVVVAAAVRHISWAAVRAGPPKHMGRLMGRAVRPIESPHLMGRGPAWLIQFREDGPRLGPAHQFFRGWAADRPSPSHFHFCTGPA